MKAKINRKLLFNAKGFHWESRYSSNENTDDIGRWARIGYYNGFCISWINGYVSIDKKVIDRKQTGVCNLFLVHLQFPTSGNQGGEVKKFDTIEEAKQFTVDMFKDFAKKVRN
jgi:hypothetical protein